MHKAYHIRFTNHIKRDIRSVQPLGDPGKAILRMNLKSGDLPQVVLPWALGRRVTGIGLRNDVSISWV